MKDNISDLINELSVEADKHNERFIQLREAMTTLSALRSERTLGEFRKKPGRPRISDTVAGAGIMLKDIPVKASKKTGKKRKYTKRSAFWKKKK